LVLHWESLRFLDLLLEISDLVVSYATRTDMGSSQSLNPLLRGRTTTLSALSGPKDYLAHLVLYSLEIDLDHCVYTRECDRER
jgi:hypothetical protein